MSKNVSIKEGDRARNFGPTAKIKTDLQAGGSCYWVPEDERETGHVFASENREYTPDEINKYGIDSIDVNIIFTGTTIDGDPWSVTIDPDTGLPIIDIDDVEITIDDITGDIDIHIPDKDPDDWPGWDDLDPDLKKDFDDWVNDGNDPDDWPGWDDLDPSIKDDFDGWINDTDITIDDADLDDFGIDPDADIDISIDDLGNVEISDGDISIDFDPETGEWDTGDCPASIYILSRPASLVYTDGDTLDFTGLAVAALDKDGMDWPDPSVFTPIPASEIITPTSNANMSDSSGSFATINGDVPVFEMPIPPYDPSSGSPSGYPTGNTNTYHGRTITYYLEIWEGITPVNIGGAIYVNKDSNGRYSYKSSIPNTSVRVAGRYSDGSFFGYTWPSSYDSIPAPESDKPIGEIDIETVNEEEAIVPVKVQWTSPCFETLETTFDITVYPKTDHGGSHHSGKF